MREDAFNDHILHLRVYAHSHPMFLYQELNISATEAMLLLKEFAHGWIFYPIENHLRFWGNSLPILTLFHAGSDTTYSTRGGIYAPPMISRKKKVFVQFLLHTPSTTKNRLTRQKVGLYLKKQKNGGRFNIAECNMTGRISSIFCIFYLFALKWL